jgi:hypothetical protein
MELFTFSMKIAQPMSTRKMGEYCDLIHIGPSEHIKQLSRQMSKNKK